MTTMTAMQPCLYYAIYGKNISDSSTGPVFSSPYPKAHRLAYRKGRYPASVHQPPFSKIISETAWPIKAKFYMKHLHRENDCVYK